MANCTKSNCKKPQAKDGNGLCADHLRLKKQDDEKFARQKKQQAEKDEQEAEKRKQMALDAEKKRKFDEEKKAKVNEIAAAWRKQVKAVVDEVLKLRHDHPGVHVNAGHNAVGNTEGGTGNPVELVVPTNNYKISKGDVLAVYKPTGSDSGYYKFVSGDIFVHCK